MNLIAKDRVLVCEIADFDACDRYLFRVTKAGPTLAVDWKLKGCGDHGKVEIGAPGLAGATKLMTFSQGNVSRFQGAVTESTEECEEGCDCHTVPLVVGRKVLAALKAGKPVELNVFGAKDAFTKKGTEKRDVLVDGKKTKVACVHATGEGGDLWVADDDEWPVIVRVESDGGDNYAEISAVATGSIDQVEETLEDD